MKLVHDYLVDGGFWAVAKRNVGHNLRGRGDDGRRTVDGGVAGHHSDVLRSENLTQGEEFLAHERLDGRGVETALATGEGDEVRGVGHHGLTGTSWSGEDDVIAGEDAKGSLFLGGIQRNTPARGP